MLNRRLLVAALVAPLAFATPVAAQDGVTVIRAAKVIDGRGAAIANGEVVVQGGKITKVGARGAAPAGARIVDLGSRTGLPGLIDGHSHLTWYFNRQGRYHTPRDGDTPIQSIRGPAVSLALKLENVPSFPLFSGWASRNVSRIGAARFSTI